jgi:arylsulfatase A-like enzyme
MPSSEKSQPFNVILISFDTLRQDHLGCYGHPKPLSPHLDELAGGGVFFADTVVNCGWTLPQHITMMTGTHPLKHRLVYLRRRCRLRKSVKTLAEMFQSSGYTCFGFANTNRFGGGWEYGFWRGMHHYTTVFPYNNMMELLPDAASWAFDMAGSKPFFMYIHTNDTHEPFAASEPFGSKWGTKYINRYEGEVSYVDHYFGMVLRESEKRGLKNHTLVVATSDHGSEFLEHGFHEKKLNMYEEISRVPLVFRLPEILPEGKKVAGLCETMDIPPTILDICSIPVPEWMDGKSLLPGMLGEGAARPSEYVIAHTLHETTYLYEHFSVRDERYKLIRTVPISKRPQKLPGEIGKRFERLASVAELEDGIWRELYDLKNDPEETKNIIGSRPDVASRLEQVLDGYITSFGYTPKG